MVELEEIVGIVSNFWVSWEEGVPYANVLIETDEGKRTVKFYCKGESAENLVYSLLESVKGGFRVSAQIERILDKNSNTYLGNTPKVLNQIIPSG